MASTRTPTKRQTQVLFAAGRYANVRTDTTAIHAWRSLMAAAATPPSHAGTQRDTYMLLGTCHRYEWVDRVRLEPGVTGDNDGNGIEWHITTAGREALQRGQAALADHKENTVDATTTVDPPTGSAPWDGEGDDPQAADLDALDANDGDDGTQDGGEGELEQPTEINQGTNQLSMKIAPGRLKPTQSKLKVKARTREFGTTREFQLGDLVPFSGTLRVDKIDVEQTKQGRIVRTQCAVIEDCDLLDADE